MLPVNTTAPDFTLKDQDGKEHSLAHHVKGPEKYILVYFYPKDDTAGCTKEACAIRDAYADFQANGVKVFGVSADSPESHKKFAEKYGLPFTLLSDPDKTTIRAYGALKESGMFKGGIARVSYLIATEMTGATSLAGGAKAGTIIKVYPRVDPASHAGEILKDLI